MKIAVTGATGFVGRHLVAELLERGHEVTAIARDGDRAREMRWFDDVRFVACDIHATNDGIQERLGELDAVAHLAWPGLPNYRDAFHYEVNLPRAYEFLKAIVAGGTTRVLVTGTCLEYGMREGCLSEELDPRPHTAYGLGKDVLRRFLMELSRSTPFQLIWCRLFYMYGEGQNSNSLLAQLDRAIERGDAEFNMSGGEQLRDYLDVREVAGKLALLLEATGADGIYNVCAGVPTSVRSLVERRLEELGATLRLNRGYYPYPDYEPFAFWGDPAKLASLAENANSRRLHV